MTVAPAAAQPETESPHLVVRSRSGVPVVVRLVHYGERFGPGGHLVQGRPRPVVELLAQGFRLTRHAGTLSVDEFCALAEGAFMPLGDPALEIDQADMQRAADWLRGGGGREAPEDEVIVLVGDDALTARLRVALSRLPFGAQRFEDGRAALGYVALAPPALVVVTDGVLWLAPEVVVAELRRALGRRPVPIAVVGGDREAALAAGADEWIPDALGAHALEDAVSGMLELV